MLGLYYSATLFDNPYINYALQRYPDTTHIATDEAEVKRYLELSTYEVVCLECKYEDMGSLILLQNITDHLREHSPETVIVIHRNKIMPLDSSPLHLPLNSYDFAFTNKLGPSELEEIIQTMILRRLSLLSSYQEPCNINGILCMRHPGVSELTYNYLRAAGFNIIRCNNLQKITAELVPIHPDFLFMHCDTKSKEYEEVKKLAAYTRNVLPECMIMVSCDIEYLDRYAKIQPIDPDTYDHLMDPAPMPLELLLLILRHEAKKYKLDIIKDHQY